MRCRRPLPRVTDFGQVGWLLTTNPVNPGRGQGFDWIWPSGVRGVKAGHNADIDWCCDVEVDLPLGFPIPLFARLAYHLPMARPCHMGHSRSGWIGRGHRRMPAVQVDPSRLAAFVNSLCIEVGLSSSRSRLFDGTIETNPKRDFSLIYFLLQQQS